MFMLYGILTLSRLFLTPIVLPISCVASQSWTLLFRIYSFQSLHPIISDYNLYVLDVLMINWKISELDPGTLAPPFFFLEIRENFVDSTAVMCHCAYIYSV
jgi:hypothetical protein